MRIWTHINASIRLDNTHFDEKYKPNLGPSTDSIYENGDKEYDGIIPCGSEGSLKYNIWYGKGEGNVADCTVSIFGDLRDYDNVEEILNYFTNITKGKSVRSGILEIDLPHKYDYQIYKYVLQKHWLRTNWKSTQEEYLNLKLGIFSTLNLTP